FERSEYKGKAVFLNTSECLFSTGNEKVWPYKLIARPAPRGHKVAGTGENAGAEAMKAILARSDALGVAARYDCQVQSVIRNEQGRVVGVQARQGGRTLRVGARRGVIMATGGFAMNSDMVLEHIPLMSET